MTTEYEKNDSAAHTYFAQINPMAERIAKAISDEKNTYGMLWYTLNRKDQDDILNDSLIKPELTLHYIDRLALKRSLSSSSLDNAIKDSMQQLSIADTQMSEEKDDAKELTKLLSTTNQQYYGFDGRSLSTFALQRVAQKLLKDDALADAGYRDEHSAPFSYRTRSQINFHLDNSDEHFNEDKQQQILQMNTSKIINELNALSKATSTKTTTTTTKNQINNVKKPKRLAPVKPAKMTKGINVDVEEIPKPDLLAANFAMTTYSNYSPVQHEDGESSSLIPRQTLHQEDDALPSSMKLNNTTSTDDDEDHEYYDESNHEQMEEVKLLDAHVSLKRGFEFLNNW